MIRTERRVTLLPAMRDALIITALMPEAVRLIEAWGLKPVRGEPTLERFQTHFGNGVYVAVSGVGKLKSAAACGSVLSTLLRRGEPVVANLGIAGARPGVAERGELFVVNKVRDAASNTRFYPDILFRHPLREAPLETHDAPVTDPSAVPGLVDMEAAGFMQAATMLVSPSAIIVLKAVSDLCDGSRITPLMASELISANLPAVEQILATWRTELPLSVELSPEERLLIDSRSEHARLSATQTLELERTVRSCKAQSISWREPLDQILGTTITTKQGAKAAFNTLQSTLRGGILP